jgi:cell division septum initiation protein DivIVA
MSDRIEQMRVEATELEKRINELAEYIGSNELSEAEFDSCATLAEVESALADAREQLEHMVAYAEVLKRRTENS